MTEIIIRNGVLTRAGDIDIVWDAARNFNNFATYINNANYYAWSAYNNNGLLLGKTTQLVDVIMPFKRPYAYLDFDESMTDGNVFYYSNIDSGIQAFNNAFIICKVRNNGKFNHILSFGWSYNTNSSILASKTMFWSGVSLSIFHDSSGNHTYIYCRSGRNYKTVRTNNFDYTTLHTFSIENVDTIGQDVSFKWNNHLLCTIANIQNGVDGYNSNNTYIGLSGLASYPQIGAGEIAGFNLPFNSVLQVEQNGVEQLYAIGIGQITDNLMEMIYMRYNYSHVPLNINQTHTYTINGTMGTIFGTTTNFSGNMQIL
jgi:hypothetical protein